MWFKTKNPAPSLSEELIERVWDVNSRLKQLEGVLDERLNELSRRYRRAEQSEHRLEAKRASSPCEDDEEARVVHPALAARRKRRERLNNRIGEKV